MRHQAKNTNQKTTVGASHHCVRSRTVYKSGFAEQQLFSHSVVNNLKQKFSVSAKLYSDVIKCTGPDNNGRTNVNVVKSHVKKYLGPSRFGQVSSKAINARQRDLVFEEYGKQGRCCKTDTSSKYHRASVSRVSSKNSCGATISIKHPSSPEVIGQLH